MRMPMPDSGRFRRLAPLAILLLTACGSALRPVAPPIVACGDDRLGATLLQPDTVECGTVGFGERTSGVTEPVIAAARRCVRRSLDRALPFRVAISRMGIDTLGCEVAVGDAEGRLWHLVHSSDASTGSARWTLGVSRCASLAWPDAAADFQLSGCVEDPEHLARELAAFSVR